MIAYLPQNYTLIHAFRPRPRGLTQAGRPVRRRIFKMAPKLQDFFPADEVGAVKGGLDRPISGLTMDSRRVVPGSLFFALPGLRTDGAAFIDEAINRGAVAVVTQKPVTLPHSKVTFIQVADARATLARVAQRYYRFPDRELEVVGVTGTNGKTTVTHLIKHLLNGDQRVGLIGTVSYDLGTRTVPSYKTTPESLDIFGMLAQMRDAGCRQAVMEVSSHGIDQQRVRGLHFSAVVFTNLTRDHLDYHKSLDAYFEVKSRLFAGGTGAPPRVAVINLDDPYGRQLAEKIPPGVRLVTFGENPAAAVRAEAVNLEFKRTTFRCVWPGSAADVESPLIGRYNVSNLLAALATCCALGGDVAALLPKLRSFKSVAGRMERIEEGQPFNVLVDYAHTDDALQNAPRHAPRRHARPPARRLRLRRKPRPHQASPHDARRAGAGRFRVGHGRQPAQRAARADLRGHEAGRRHARQDHLHRRTPPGHQPRLGRRPAGRLPAHRGQGPRVLPGVRRHSHPVRRPAGGAGADRGQADQGRMNRSGI